MDKWLTEIIVGAAVAMIVALISAFVGLRNTRKQLELQREQFKEQKKLTKQQLNQQSDHFEREYMLLRKQLEQRVLQNKEGHKQTVQAFVDYLNDVRSLNKPPMPSETKLWNVAYRRLRETRRRLYETLSLLPGEDVARRHLVPLLEAFHAWSDKWDQYGDYADTDTGERELMSALSDLQRARCKAEDELRDELNLSKLKSKTAPNKGAEEMYSRNEKNN